MIHWNVSPEIISLGPIHIRWYGLMFLAGFSIGYRFMAKVCQREGYVLERLEPLLIHVVLGTVIGARVAHCLFYDPTYYLANPLKILAVWEGGLASHGGGLGVILGIWIFQRRHQEFKLSWIYDRIALCTVLTGGFIRVGNLMNSEILGLPTNSDYGVVFERVDKIPRHPSMVYESVSYFAFSAILFWLYWNWERFEAVFFKKIAGSKASQAMDSKAQKKKKPELRLPPRGFLFGAVLALIFIARFFIEFYKENQETFNLGMPLNMGQLLSIPFIVVGLGFVFRALMQNRKDFQTA